jgi:hypothetical protein
VDYPLTWQGTRLGCLVSLGQVSSEGIVLRDGARILRFTYEDMLRYHGGGSPGGVAHAFKVLERGLPRLGAAGTLQRRQIEIETAFGGPGARDGFELVTRAVTENRYRVSEALRRGELGPGRERFVFRLSDSTHSTTLTVREGFVTLEFLALSRQPDRSAVAERRFDALKADMASRVMAAPAEQVYDAEAD